MVARTQEKRRIERSLTRLRTDHQVLSQEWRQIQTDPAFTEYLIRKNLGYVKKGEVEYQIIKPNEKP